MVELEKQCKVLGKSLSGSGYKPPQENSHEIKQKIAMIQKNATKMQRLPTKGSAVLQKNSKAVDSKPAGVTVNSKACGQQAITNQPNTSHASDQSMKESLKGTALQEKVQTVDNPSVQQCSVQQKPKGKDAKPVPVSSVQIPSSIQVKQVQEASAQEAKVRKEEKVSPAMTSFYPDKVKKNTKQVTVHPKATVLPEKDQQKPPKSVGKSSFQKGSVQQKPREKDAKVAPAPRASCIQVKHVQESSAKVRKEEKVSPAMTSLFPDKASTIQKNTKQVMVHFNQTPETLSQTAVKAKVASGGSSNANKVASAKNALCKEGSPADRHPMEAESSSLDHLRQSVAKVRIDPHVEFCPFELEGRCNDDSCSYQHIGKR